MVLNGPCWSEMVQGGPSFQNGERCLKHWKKIHVANEWSERQRGEGRRRKNGNARTSSPFLRFNLFSVFFSLCLNLSMWPGRQVVPDESWCSIPIFDGPLKLNARLDLKHCMITIAYCRYTTIGTHLGFQRHKFHSVLENIQLLEKSVIGHPYLQKGPEFGTLSRSGPN